MAHDPDVVNRSREALNAVGTSIVEACLCVHRALGPGLLESAYQECITYELESRGHVVTREVPLPLVYRGQEMKTRYRMDMVVDSCVVVENKSIQALLPIHQAQLLTYLRLSDLRLGYLVNWNVPLIKDGIIRMVNRL